MSGLFPEEYSGDKVFIPAMVMSGGQTGVDRAILDWAIDNGVTHGGWCPAGRRAEDGPLDSRYQLTPLASSRYADRTRQNVIDSDATMIFCLGKPSGGTLLTASVASGLAKPLRLITYCSDASLERTAIWLGRIRPARLNVAGPRASTTPGIYRQAYDFFDRLWGPAIAAMGGEASR